MQLKSVLSLKKSLWFDTMPNSVWLAYWRDFKINAPIEKVSLTEWIWIKKQEWDERINSVELSNCCDATINDMWLCTDCLEHCG